MKKKEQYEGTNLVVPNTRATRLMICVLIIPHLGVSRFLSFILDYKSVIWVIIVTVTGSGWRPQSNLNNIRWPVCTAVKAHLSANCGMKNQFKKYQPVRVVRDISFTAEDRNMETANQSGSSYNIVSSKYRMFSDIAIQLHVNKGVQQHVKSGIVTFTKN